MAASIYISKRYLKGKRANGRRPYKLVLRWRNPDTGKLKCEATGTADRTEAESLRKLKWAEINGLVPPRQEPDVDQPAAPTWVGCREAIERAMKADNLRLSYVADALLLFDGLQVMFPDLASPADVTPDMANEYKRRRSEAQISSWTLKGDLATLKAVFGKWLGRECGLLSTNPFANVKPPKCDDPDVRIVSAAETADLFNWLAERWNNWKLPQVYLHVAALVGWRATELAAIREEDLLPDGFVRVAAESSKSRKHKYTWLPTELLAELRACCAGGWAFGRFADELRRLLMLWRKQPHHAAKIKGYSPARLVGWLQDELQRYNDEREKEAQEANPRRTWERFTLHDFRRTAITGMQMAGVSEKEASVMVGATPEVIRRHYEKMDQLAIAKRSVERRIGADGTTTVKFGQQSVRALFARSVDRKGHLTQSVTA